MNNIYLYNIRSFNASSYERLKITGDSLSNITRSKRNMRRSHEAITPLSGAICPNCKAIKLPHRVCSSCGFYKTIDSWLFYYFLSNLLHFTRERI